MRTASTQRAINAAGGVLRLSQALGIKQPSVSKWKKIPAERVLLVEAMTGISRHDLRPDIFGPAPASSPAGSGGTTPAGSGTAPPGDSHARE